jgi:hypothetical protein
MPKSGAQGQEVAMKIQYGAQRGQVLSIVPVSRLIGVLAVVLWAGVAQGANVYVVPTNAAAAAPYDTWAKAAASIQVAVDYASTHAETYNTVILSSGTYSISKQIVIASGITVRSSEGGLKGAAKTIIRRGGGDARIFSIRHPGAVVEGFTIRDGKGNGLSEGSGGGVYMTDGLIRECIITANALGQQHTDGVGIYMTGGTVLKCVITENKGGWNNSSGGGICAKGGQIISSRIVNNSIGNCDGGGILAGRDVLIRNCLITGNRAAGSGGGVAGGRIENCTIAGNTAQRDGGGVYGAQSIMDSIVYGNWTNKPGVHTNNYAMTGNIHRTCTWPRPGADDGNTDSDPLFVNPAAGDYHLQAEPVRSPCIDVGPNLEWMAADTDVEGKGRIFGNVVDRGALEFWAPKPMIRDEGVGKLTEKSATVRCRVVWPGTAEPTLFVFHGPADGGTNRAAWAHELRLPDGGSVGLHEAGISHEAGNGVWFYRLCATNVHGTTWEDSTSGLMLGAVEVKASRRESTEAKPAEFVVSRPATATNGTLKVYFTIGGTGVNGEDYDLLESPAIMPAGAAEVRLPVVPNFNEDDKRSKGVELTIVPGGYQIGLNRKASMVTKAQ